VQVLAQMHAPGSGGSLALSIIALFAMIIPWFVLGYVSWIFWKAKKRDAAEEARLQQRRQAEQRWRNAHSS
jgi:cbb3-type cytochrome oxidase subunit 3